MTHPIPSSDDSEQAVLGCVLLGSDDAIEAVLRIPEDAFFSRRWRTLFVTMRSMVQANRPVDLITVVNQLTSDGHLEEVGGASTVAGLATAMPTSAHVAQYIEILMSKRKLRTVIEICAGASEAAAKDSGDRADDISRNLEAKCFEINSVERGRDEQAEAFDNALKIVQNLKDKRRIAALPTGIETVDSIAHGYVDGRMYVIGARPGFGKTSWILQSMTPMAIAEIPVLFFSSDMSPEMVIQKQACQHLDFSFWAYESGHLRDSDYVQIEMFIGTMRNKPLYVEAPARLTGPDIVSLVRRYKRQKGIRAVFLDYFQLLGYDDKNRTEGLTKAAESIKNVCRGANIPFVVLAQLNKEAAEGRPLASNIKDCDALLAACDVQFLIWSKEDPTTLAPGQYWQQKCLIAKNRYGPTGEVDIQFDRNLAKYVKIAHDKPGTSF